MKHFSIDDIRSWEPCYDPSKHLSETWQGTTLDILNMSNVPSQDRLWVVLRPKVTNERTLQLFAIWCARQVEHLMTDERSRHALDVAENYLNGLATQEESRAAAEAASRAAAEASRAASRAAWAAAEAAWAASRAAAEASRAAASRAAWAASRAAAEASRARENQVNRLREMIEKDEENANT